MTSNKSRDWKVLSALLGEWELALLSFSMGLVVGLCIILLMT